MKRLLRISLAPLLMLVFTGVALAQSGSGFDLTWSTVDGGGGTSTGGVLSLQGTIGQPDAGTLLGGSYALQGGFWDIAQSPANTPTATPTSTPVTPVNQLSFENMSKQGIRSSYEVTNAGSVTANLVHQYFTNGTTLLLHSR